MIASVETHSGKYVHLVSPHPKQINFNDIAWALSRIARFNGHTHGEHPYSVAQHSVWVAFIAQHVLRADRKTTLQALFHDAHEAYMGDITSPLKGVADLTGPLKSIAESLQQAIHLSQAIPAPDDNALAMIAEADRCALSVEARHLVYSNGSGWACSEDVPEEVYGLFWRPLPAMDAFDLFWMAREYIASDISLEELWQSVAP